MVGCGRPAARPLEVEHGPAVVEGPRNPAVDLGALPARGAARGGEEDWNMAKKQKKRVGFLGQPLEFSW